MVEVAERIKREDIEKKVRDIQSGVSEDVEGAKALAMPAIIAIVLVLLGLTYALGRRSGRKRSMILEIKSS